jgi:anthranilate phosphoribosyltransferase
MPQAAIHLVAHTLEAVDTSAPLWFTDALAALVARRDLTGAQMRSVMEELIAGRCAEAEAAALLVALHMKGETATEMAAAAAVLRAHMVRLETGRADVLDTCGTGGDGIGTFNISTATALVVAGAGVPVVKHGNRAASGTTGSADVLAELGVAIADDVARVRRCLDEAGLGFCFAPHFHPALRHVAGVRRRLRLRTLFNCLGPLANPAGAAYQLLGVGRPEWLDPLAGALAELGVRRALLVCGADGLDEVTLSAPTRVREVAAGAVTAHTWTPADFGLQPCALADLRAGSPQESAAIIRALLQGGDIPAARVVLANAAAALLAAERVTSLPEGVGLARESIASGRAGQVVARLIACSHG